MAAARGVTAADWALGGPVPVLFTAATVNRYDLPLTSPPTGKLVTTEAVTIFLPGDAVTTYPVTGDPSSDDGGGHDTSASAGRAEAITPVRAPGTPAVAAATAVAAPGPAR